MTSHINDSPQAQLPRPQQPQQPQHCDHECVCMGYCNHAIPPYGEPCPKPGCEYDTRASHSSAPASEQPDELFDRIFKAINDSRTNLGKEFTTGYETNEHDLPIISDEFDELFTKIEAIRQSAQQPPFQNPLAKENLTVGMIYAYEAGLEEGKQQPPAPAADALLDELETLREWRIKYNKMGGKAMSIVDFIESLEIEIEDFREREQSRAALRERTGGERR